MLVALLLAAGQMLAVTAAPEPVAMVLKVKGVATIERGDAPAKPLLVMCIVRAGDRLKTAADGDAVLVLLTDSHWERLKPNSQATAEKKGCSPPSAIELLDHPKLPAESLSGLPALDPSRRAGVAVLRGSEAIPEPIFGTVLLDSRPTFFWPSDEVDVQKTPIDDFRIELMAADLQGKSLWSATTTVSSLAYPAKEPPLRAGESYAWRVTARLQGGKKQVLVEGKFSMANDKQHEAAAEIDKLAASKSWPDQLLAAALYESHGFYGDALSQYECLLSSADRPRGVDPQNDNPTKNITTAMQLCNARAWRAIRSKEAANVGKP